MSGRSPNDQAGTETVEETDDYMTLERQAFGRALAAARKARGVSQTELGQRVGGIVQATISSWETGVTEPTAAQVFALEEALGVRGGQLSRCLGYVPTSDWTSSTTRAPEYIVNDPNLEPWAKRVVLGVYNEVATSGAPRRDFEHAVFFHQGKDEYYAGVSEYLRQGLASEEPVVVMAGEHNSDLLSTMGRDIARVSFWEDRNPGRLINRWRTRLSEHPAGIRAVQDHPWFCAGLGKSLQSLYWLEHHRHEVMLNIAFADGPGWTLLCPYDLDAVPDEEAADRANRSHPLVWENGALRPNPGYTPATPESILDMELPDLPFKPSSQRFDPTDWRESLRPIFATAKAKLADETAFEFSTAVKDVASASARDGRGEVTLCWWAEKGAVGCEVADEGQITDPFVADSEEPGQALAQAQQLCDLVALRSNDSGTVVRMYMLVEAKAGTGMAQTSARAAARARKTVRADGPEPDLAQLAEA